MSTTETIEREEAEALATELRALADRGFSVHFGSLKHENGWIEGDVKVHWEETVHLAGKDHRIVLIDNGGHFKTKDNAKILEKKFTFLKVFEFETWAEVYVDGPITNNHGHACLKARAEWHGPFHAKGSLGAGPFCTSF